MFLKSLEIRGFKSFADRTELIFEPGITVVVGPNGSGKSNIVDAVTWVLGAQGPRALRGTKMDDVIFAGSPQRSALSRAQVMLTIDNSTGILPIDLVEVAISRVLYRNGESEYSINGAPCRLLDIQELLSDTGIGRQFHTIVGQGQLDTILSARPEDRRAVIEEAAGILKFRKRKEKALRRLAATESNVTRLQDLIRELNRQLRPLEKQAEAARKYGSVEERLHELRWCIIASEYCALSESTDRKLLALEQARASIATEKQRLTEFETEVGRIEEALSANRDEADDIGELRERISEMVTCLASLLEIAAVKVESYRARVSAPEVLSFDILEAEKSRLDKRIVEVDECIESARRRLAIAIENERAAALVHRDSLARKAGGESSRRAAELRGERSALESSVSISETEASRLVERRRKNQSRLERSVAERERLTREIERLDSEATPLTSEVERLKALRDTARSELEALDAQHRSAQADASLWSGRLEAMRIVAEEEAVAEGSRYLADSGGVGIAGVLKDLVEVDRGYEAAVDAGLGELLDAVVVTSREVVNRGVLALKAEEAGVATFVESSKFRSGSVEGTAVLIPEPGEAEPLLAHVTARPNALGVSDVLREALARTYVVESWKAAWDLSLRYPDVHVVTRTGDRLGGNGIWRGGSDSRGPLRQMASLSEVAESARRAGSVVTELERAIERRRDELRKVDEALEVLESALLENDAMLTAAAGQLRLLGPEIEDLEGEAALLAEIENELAERLTRDRDRLAEIDRELATLRQSEEDLDFEDDVTADLQDAEKLLEAASNERTAAGIALAQFEERKAVMMSRLEEIDGEVAVLAEAEPLRAEKRRNATRAEKVARSVLERARALEPRIASIAEAIGRCRDQSLLARESLETQLTELRRGIEAARREIVRLSELERELDLEQVEAGVRLTQLVETMRTEFDRDPSEARSASPPDGVDEANLTGEAAALEREIRQMGPVNPMALEQYERLSERIDFVKEQLEDLKSSRRELLKIVRAVDRKIVEVFQAAFEDVSQHFDAIVGKLFPGGKGRLRLTDAQDLLETGIEVDVRPAGKNVRKLSLLSGGERSMAALAFLFAVFRARPSPFYLLDEVEAALDDLNLHRFLELINEFRDESQIVLITHQKRSMDVADCLYGVSMQRSGVTKVVSQKMTNSVRV